jgi:hypothetical protein
LSKTVTAVNALPSASVPFVVEVIVLPSFERIPHAAQKHTTPRRYGRRWQAETCDEVFILAVLNLRHNCCMTSARPGPSASGLSSLRSVRCAACSARGRPCAGTASTCRWRCWNRCCFRSMDQRRGRRQPKFAVAGQVPVWTTDAHEAAQGLTSAR